MLSEARVRVGIFWCKRGGRGRNRNAGGSHWDGFEAGIFYDLLSIERRVQKERVEYLVLQ